MQADPDLAIPSLILSSWLTVPQKGKGAPFERARPFWEGAPLVEGHVHFDLIGEKGRAPFGRSRSQCHIENLTY